MAWLPLLSSDLDKDKKPGEATPELLGAPPTSPPNPADEDYNPATAFAPVRIPGASQEIQPQPMGLGDVAYESTRRGLNRALTETAQAVHPFEDVPTESAPNDQVTRLLGQKVSEGWSNPQWWVAQITNGLAGSSPSLAISGAGVLGGNLAGGPIGGLVGGGLGFGLGNALQTIAPAYQQARREGLTHDQAVDRAMAETGLAGAVGTAMGVAPGMSFFGKTAEGALRKPLSEALLQIFGVQPGMAAGGTVARNQIEGKTTTLDDLATQYATNTATGLGLTGILHGANALSQPTLSTAAEIGRFLDQAKGKGANPETPRLNTPEEPMGPVTGNPNGSNAPEGPPPTQPGAPGAPPYQEPARPRFSDEAPPPDRSTPTPGTQPNLPSVDLRDPRAQLQAEVAKQLNANPKLAAQLPDALSYFDENAPSTPVVNAAAYDLLKTGKVSKVASQLIAQMRQPTARAAQEAYGQQLNAATVRATELPRAAEELPGVRTAERPFMQLPEVAPEEFGTQNIPQTQPPEPMPAVSSGEPPTQEGLVKQAAWSAPVRSLKMAQEDFGSAERRLAGNEPAQQAFGAMRDKVQQVIALTAAGQYDEADKVLQAAAQDEKALQAASPQAGRFYGQFVRQAIAARGGAPMPAVSGGEGTADGGPPAPTPESPNQPGEAPSQPRNLTVAIEALPFGGHGYIRGQHARDALIDAGIPHEQLVASGLEDFLNDRRRVTDKQEILDTVKNHVPPRRNPEGYAMLLPFKSEWGDPRYDEEDHARALGRLQEIETMNVQTAPWKTITSAITDLNQIAAQMFFYDESRTDVKMMREHLWETAAYMQDREADAETRPNVRSSMYWEPDFKTLPDDMRSIARAGFQAIEHLIAGGRRGVLDALRWKHNAEKETEPKGRRKGPVPADEQANTMRSGYYFPVARALAKVPRHLFSMGGQAVIDHLRGQGISKAEIAHFGLDTLAQQKPVKRSDFQDRIGAAMYDFKRKTSFFNPEFNRMDYAEGGTRAFAGPRIPGRGLYFEELLAFPKSYKAGQRMGAGQFISPHWNTEWAGTWASWRGSQRDVPGFGKMVIGEEGQSDFMQGANIRRPTWNRDLQRFEPNTARRPRIPEAEYLQLQAQRDAYYSALSEAKNLLNHIYTIGKLQREEQDHRTIERAYEKGQSAEKWAETDALLLKHVLEDAKPALAHYGPDYLMSQLTKLLKVRQDNPAFFEPNAYKKYAQTEQDFTSSTPIDQNYVRVMVRDLLLLAGRRNADSVAISTTDTSARIQNNDTASHFYDSQLRPSLEKELRRLSGDNTLTLQKVALPKPQGGPKMRPYTVWAAKIPAELRAKIKAGLPMFALRGFYSAPIRAVENASQEKMSPQQWKAVLSGHGVPQDQVNWTGVKQWLDTIAEAIAEAKATKVPKSEIKTSVPKAEVKAFLEMHQIDVQKRVMSTAGENSEGAEDRSPVEERAQALYDELMAEQQAEEHREWRRYNDPNEVYEVVPFVSENLTQAQKDRLQFAEREVQMAKSNGKPVPDFKELLGEGFPTGAYLVDLKMKTWARGSSDLDEDVEIDDAYDTREEAMDAAQEKLDELEAAFEKKDEEREQSVWDDTADRDHEVWGEAMRMARREQGLDVDNDDEDRIEGDETVFRSMAIKGGDDYSELLVRLPALKEKGYKSPHFGSDEVVHVRYDYRTTGERGAQKKVLFIHEIQSDLHQRARDFGYGAEGKSKAAQMVSDFGWTKELRAEKAALQQQLIDLPKEYARQPASKETSDAFEDHMASVRSQLRVLDEKASKDQRRATRYLENFGETGGAPDVPWKGNAWWELGFKAALQQAVEDGCDGIALTLPRQIQEASSTPGHVARKFYGENLPRFIDKYMKQWGSERGNEIVSGTPTEQVLMLKPGTTATDAANYLERLIGVSTDPYRRNEFKSAFRPIIEALRSEPDMPEHQVEELLKGHPTPRYWAGMGYAGTENGQHVTVGRLLVSKILGDEQPYWPITPELTQDIISTQGGLAYATNTDTSVNAGKLYIQDQISKGKSVDFGERNVGSAFDALQPLLSMVPKGMEVAVLRRVSPAPRTLADRLKGAPVSVVAEFETETGEIFDYEWPMTSLFGMRALFNPAWGDMKPRILFVRYGETPLLDKRIRGELRHEVLHALRFDGRLTGTTWQRLVNHALDLGVLNITLKDYLSMIGEAPIDTDIAPLGAVYYRRFKGLPDYDERMQQEAVAHMVELYSHGHLTQSQIRPIADILDDLDRGAFSGSIDELILSQDLREYLQPSLALDASPAIIPGLPEADRRIIRQASATLRSDGTVYAGRPSNANRSLASRQRDGATPQPVGRVEPFDAEGLAGFVLANPLPGKTVDQYGKSIPCDRVGDLQYALYPAGTRPAETRNMSREGLNDALAYAHMMQHPDGTWEMLYVQARERGKGYGSMLYDAIERDLGIKMSPSGTLTKAGYEFWSKRSPASVAWHTWMYDSSYYESPRRVKARIADTVSLIADYESLPDRNPQEEATLRDLRHERNQLQAIMVRLPKEARKAIPSMFAADTDTPFDRWFGDSKVVDEHGAPEVVYHGGAADIREFDIHRAGGTTDAGILGRGFYFSNEKHIARFYRRSGGSVYDTYLNIENPLKVKGTYFDNAEDQMAFLGRDDAPSFYTKLIDLLNKFQEDHPEANLADYGLANAVDDFHYGEDSGRDIASAITDMLQDYGYDGVAFTFPGKIAGTEYVAFHPTQIKSATDNSGNYDPSNPDIYAASSGGDDNVVPLFGRPAVGLHAVPDYGQQLGQFIGERLTSIPEQFSHGISYTTPDVMYQRYREYSTARREEPLDKGTFLAAMANRVPFGNMGGLQRFAAKIKETPEEERARDERNQQRQELAAEAHEFYRLIQENTDWIKRAQEQVDAGAPTGDFVARRELQKTASKIAQIQNMVNDFQKELDQLRQQLADLDKPQPRPQPAISSTEEALENAGLGPYRQALARAKQLAAGKMPMDMVARQTGWRFGEGGWTFTANPIALQNLGLTSPE